MKTRRSLLLALGIAVSLSMAVPASATQQPTIPAESAAQIETEGTGTADDAVGGGEAEKDTVDSTDSSSQTVPQTLDNTEPVAGTADGDAVPTPTQEPTPSVMATPEPSVAPTDEPEVTEEWSQTEDGRWQYLVGGEPLKDTLFAPDGSDQVFYFDASGYLATGLYNITDKTQFKGLDGESFALGLYGFETEGQDPRQDGLGAMVTNDWMLSEQDNSWHWLTETGLEDNTGKDGWQQIDEKWYYLNGAGQAAADKTGWQQIDEDWYFLNADGTVDSAKDGWQQVSEGKWLYAQDGKGEIRTGWQEISGKWYCLKDDGTRDTGKTGIQTINGAQYYVNSDGSLKKNTTVDQDGMRYVLGADGKVQKSYKPVKEQWMRNSTGWWYQREDGTYPKNCWEKIGGRLYSFDANGYMRSGGWYLEKGTWYYLESSGAAKEGWLLLNGNWYYLQPGTGKMLTGWYQVSGIWYFSDASGAMYGQGWHLIGNSWYYMNGSGHMLTGWQRINGTWYYMDSNGHMLTGWQKIDGTWYYMDGSGHMLTGWQQINGTWYYMNGSGAMLTGWQRIGNTWYYMNGSGAMLTGWQMINGTWYYMNGSGAMLANQWVDGYYYVGANGAMVTSSYVGGYYVGADGRWIPGYDPVISGGSWESSGGKWYFKTADGIYLKSMWQKINGEWYHFDSTGAMATGWTYIDGYKYYFDSNGHMLQDLESVMGRQSSYEITVNRAKCQITVWAKDGSNGYIIPYKTFVCSVGLPGTPTPTGTFYTPAKYRWHTLMGPSYGQYCTRVVGGVLFHSVAGSNMTSYNLSAAEYNKLGSPASHGCIRMTVRDAKWIYDNCSLGTKVTISDTAYTPYDKPSAPKIPASQNWDPTDPNV